MLHYYTYEHASSTQWVTFVHGAGGSSTIWYKQLKDFKAHFNILLVDLRGHGKSKNKIYETVKKYNFSELSDEIIEVLNHLKIQKSHFIGISLGTILIRDIGERYATRTSSMILGGAVMKLNFRGQILMRVGTIFQSLLPYLLLYRFFAFVIMPKKRNQESRNLFVREAKKLQQREFKRWFSLVAEVNPLLRFFRDKDLGMPTLYVMGEDDYMFLPTVKKIVKDHSHTELHIIPECGHVVNVEAPKSFNDTVIAFIKKQSVA